MMGAVILPAQRLEILRRRDSETYSEGGGGHALDRDSLVAEQNREVLTRLWQAANGIVISGGCSTALSRRSLLSADRKTVSHG
jgi:hypothetical protein